VKADKKPQRLPAASWLWIPLLLLTVCNRLFWSRHAISISPDGRFRLTVWTRSNIADSSVRIALSEMESLEMTILSDPADRWPDLTEVYWDVYSKRVGVLVCDGLGSNILFAYDLDQRKAISPEVVVGGIRQSLVSRYHLTGARLQSYKGDPVACACDSRSGNFERFRNIIADRLILPPLGERR